MAIPCVPIVSLNFSDGPVFGNPFTIGDSTTPLGVGVLADKASLTVDLSSSTTSIKITRKRDVLQDTYLAGTAIVRVLDPNSYFNPQNINSPYYGFIQPLRKLRISTVYNGVTYYLFSGYTTDYKYTYPQNQVTGYVDIYCVDAFRIFNMSAITTVTGNTTGDTTGTRIGQVLNTLNWPTGMRSISAGSTTCQSDPGNSRAALYALKQYEETEFGAFYVDTQGQAVFKSRAQVIAAAGGTPTVFAQDGSGIAFANVKFAFDDKQIINQANMQNVGGTMQTSTSASSILSYFQHAFTRNDLLAQTDADALNIAQAYVASRKDTSIRIDELMLDLTTANYTAGVTAALALQYFDQVKITANSPGGSTIVKTLQVQGITHEITPNSWFTTLQTLEPIIDGFIIGSSLYGILGTSTMAY